jgi:hypothetical protein
MRPTSINKKVGVVECTCHPSYTEKHKQEDHNPDSPRHKPSLYVKNNQKGLAAWLKRYNTSLASVRA